MQAETSNKQGILAWFVINHRAANLLMMLFLICGLLAVTDITQEVFPDYDLDIITISVPYPGASPEEVEKGIILAIEEKILNHEFVERVRSVAAEGRASLTIDLAGGADADKSLQIIKNEVDRISSLPDDAERPNIQLRVRQREVLRMALYGPLSEAEFYDTANTIKNDLLSLAAISLVEVRGIRNPEISIEVSQHVLNEFGLTLDDISNAVQAKSVDIPGGAIKTSDGEILLRTVERKDFAHEFENLEIISTGDGSSVKLKDIATVTDGFEDSVRRSFYNGQPSVVLLVHRVGDQTPQSVSAATRQFVDSYLNQLPEGVNLTIYTDRSKYYQERLNLLLRNGILGLCLVLFVLGIFLEPRLAFWVSMGIPISIIGSFIILWLIGGSINMVSMFAFIVTLGIIVDDAVIVGENIYFHRLRESDSITAAIKGAREMSLPVFVAVLTNILAFIPLLFVPGSMGKFFSILPAVVISVFIISFFECLYILPTHLSYRNRNSSKKSTFFRIHLFFERIMEQFVEYLFKPFLLSCLKNRYITLIFAIAFLSIAFVYWQTGWINFSFRPRIQTDSVDAEIELPYGSSVEEVQKIADYVEEKGYEVIADNGGSSLVVGVRKEIGRGGSNYAEVTFTLVPQTERELSTRAFSAQWRKKVGMIPGLEKLFFDFLIGPGGASAINIELSHPDPVTLENAASNLAGYLQQYNGVTDINDGFAQGKPQLDFQLSPAGSAAGLSAQSLGSQIRHAFYGAQAIRQQRGNDEIKVMVRLPEDERQFLYTLDHLLIKTGGSTLMPLRQAAEISYNRAYTEIVRVDGRRVINVTANVSQDIANENKILASLRSDYLPDLTASFSGLRYSFQGRERERQKSVQQLLIGISFLFPIIFAILAILFRSYLQAVLIMAVIPFGIIGALLGHIVMGYDLSIISIFGMIALCGVVINGGIVFTVTANKYRNDNEPIIMSTLRAAIRRFRPITLTATTTFLGLAPMIFEQSIQARFLVPMAISLGYGIVFSTVVILVLTPCLYVIASDIAKLFRTSA